MLKNQWKFFLGKVIVKNVRHCTIVAVSFYVCNFFQNMPDCAYCRFDLRTGVPMGVYFCGILDNRFERKSILWVNTLEQMVSAEKQVIT